MDVLQLMQATTRISIVLFGGCSFKASAVRRGACVDDVDASVSLTWVPPAATPPRCLKRSHSPQSGPQIEHCLVARTCSSVSSKQDPQKRAAASIWGACCNTNVTLLLSSPKARLPQAVNHPYCFRGCPLAAGPTVANRQSGGSPLRGVAATRASIAGL